MPPTPSHTCWIKPDLRNHLAWSRRNPFTIFSLCYDYELVAYVYVLLRDCDCDIDIGQFDLLWIYIHGGCMNPEVSWMPHWYYIEQASALSTRRQSNILSAVIAGFDKEMYDIFTWPASNLWGTVISCFLTFRGSTAIGSGYYNGRNNAAVTAANGYNSPVGWDKSYPLKPMQNGGGTKTISNGSNAPIYRKNSTLGTIHLGRPQMFLDFLTPSSRVTV